MKPLQIVFAGTPEFGLPCLEALKQSQHTVTAVYTQPDRPSGRGRKLAASSVKNWAIAHNIPVYQPLHFKTPEKREELAALQPDVMVVIAYGLILPKAVLDIPRLGCINVHASLLPRWRGASPIQQAVLAGDQESGVTIMQMDVGLDTGPMLAKASCSLAVDETTGSLHDKLAELAAPALITTLNSLASGTAHAELQPNDDVTYAAKINKEDARINWQESAVLIDRKIRAFSPWPIAYSLLEGENIRIHKARPVPLDSDKTPGTVLRLDKAGLLVATACQALLIESLQFPGGRAVSVADYLNSGKDQLHVGVVLE